MAQRDSQESHYLSTFTEFEQNGASASPDWLKTLRKQAIAEFERTGFPTARRGNEMWKYTDVRSLASRTFARSKGNAHEHIDFAPYDLPCPRVHQLVFVDGHYAADLSTEPPSEAAHRAETVGHRSEGLIVGRLSEAIQERMPLVEQHLSQSVGASGRQAASTVSAAAAGLSGYACGRICRFAGHSGGWGSWRGLGTMSRAGISMRSLCHSKSVSVHMRGIM